MDVAQDFHVLSNKVILTAGCSNHIPNTLLSYWMNEKLDPCKQPLNKFSPVNVSTYTISISNM